ncbi:zinc finger protein 271-like [Ostrinia furnacalis]|uniref:zinc finger protein 271-like n=1 Tax=Ostrinia furnacalis TaxID=93504 RepID=UPI00103F7B2D|nr:zinc finger protein 271-like [Ostrinia furnacalis]
MMDEELPLNLEDMSSSNQIVRKKGRPLKLEKKLRPTGGAFQNIMYEKKLKDKPIKLCRVCLNAGDIPIHGDETIEDLSESLIFYGGIEVLESDNFPKFLCHACHEQLQNAIMFRKTAIETDQFLRVTEQKEEVEYAVSVKQEYLDIDDDIFQETLADINTKYHCKLCKIDFDNSTDYGTHMLTDMHSRVRDKCPFCNRKFNYIQKHLTHHRNFKTIKCEICNHKYLESLIKRHKDTHFSSPTYKCTECPYRTRFGGDYKVHLRKHTGERPYQCQHCTAKFINKSNLTRHEYTHRNQLPLYPCDKCEKGFYTERELSMHTKADHDGAREHLCNICGKAFGYRKSMTKHQLKVHKREKLISGRKRALSLQLRDHNDADQPPDKKIKNEIHSSM